MAKTNKAKKDEKKTDKPKESFPRIVTSANLKSYTRDKDSISVKFKNLGFTRSQQDILDQLLDSEEEIVITLAATQGRLC